MRRDLETQLLTWKQSKRRKPLILGGARQVGKTYLLKQFGDTHYPDVAYFNFEEEPALDELFHGRLSHTDLTSKLSIYRGSKIEPESTLVILDEIQLSDHALTSLKYFSESGLPYHVVAAGSLLGVKLSSAKSFPVGKVEFLGLHPLTFFEFLTAIGKGELRGFLEDLEGPQPIPTAFHAELMDLLRIYLFVGGMPEVVDAFVSERRIELVRKKQKDILRSYGMDFSKHAEPADVMKITRIWDSIPSQLAKENKKFIFTAVARSARAREYESAVQWLQDAGLILRAARAEIPRLPLHGYSDSTAFKVYMFDVGLLGAMANLPQKAVLSGDQLFTEFKGALTENFVAQELTSHREQPLYYWKSDGNAEVDFLVEEESLIVPLEAKAGISAHSKSLREYQRRFKPPLVARATTLNLMKQGSLVNYPLYLLCRFPHLR